MKINNLTAQSINIFNTTFRQEQVYINKNGEQYLRINIYDKNYNFKITDEVKDPIKLNNMIENIKKSLSGYFVRRDRHEYFIPYILNKSPNIIYNNILVENGNTLNTIDENYYNIIQILQKQIKNKINTNDLKMIRYLVKPIEGYANNFVNMAYSYLDKVNNDLYLYTQHNKKLEILTNGCFIKNIKL